MNTKTFRFGSIKAGPAAGLKEGQMVAYASIFGNVDSYGDIVVKGAFKNTLAEWEAKEGRTLPLLYGHNMSDPNMNIGGIIKAEEDNRGLKITAEFDDDPTAQKVYKLVKAGRIAELSFAFETVKSAMISDKERPDAYRELQELKLFECSVVPIGANSETEVLAIKGLDGILTQAKAGRTLSKANETSLRDARADIAKALESIDSVLPAPADDTQEEPSSDSAKSGVESEGSNASGISSGTGPTLGVDEIKALVQETVAAALISSSGSSDPIPSDPLVTEVEVLGLLQDLQ